ncbi:MAG: hypothetical protein IPO58_05910 [Betaproteobacteria bacterium]|nr:hypothetical protein [Betaproteobacteria bacterium]
MRIGRGAPPQRAAGIHAVITAADFPGQRYLHLGVRYADRHPLAVDKVRFYGEEVAAVAADSPALARQALALIAVDYEPLPAALTPEAALRPGAPEVHDGALTAAGRNIAIRFACDYGDVAGAFARAAHVFGRVRARHRGAGLHGNQRHRGALRPRHRPTDPVDRDAGAVLRAQGSRARAGPGHRTRAYPGRRGRRRLRRQVQRCANRTRSRRGCPSRPGGR